MKTKNVLNASKEDFTTKMIRVKNELLIKHGLKETRSDVDSVVLTTTDGKCATIHQLLNFNDELAERLKNG